MVDDLIRLFDETATTFTTNGLGGLPDAVSCTVHEEINGEFELEMEYPINGRRYDLLALRRIIVAKPNTYTNPQAFRIYSITKPIDGVVTVNAAHISYDLAGYPVSPFTAQNAAQSLSNMLEASLLPCPFIFSTNIVKQGELEVSAPSSIRNVMGKAILNVYGGEYDYDNFLIHLYKHRGSDLGVTLRYGKNLIDFQQEENCNNVYTGIYPYYLSSDKESLVELSEKIINAPGTFSYVRVLPVDLSSEFEEEPTEDELRTKAQEYLDRHNIGKPEISLIIEYVPLNPSDLGELLSVTFVNEGTYYRTIYVSPESEIEAPIAPEDTSGAGREFDNWYYTSNGTGEPAVFPMTVTSDVVLYSKFVPARLKTPIVTGEANGYEITIQHVHYATHYDILADGVVVAHVTAPPELNAPIVSMNENNCEIIISEVEHANRYDILANDEVIATIGPIEE